MSRYPPMPMEVDDECIHADRIEQQPSDLPSWMAGFNANVDVYRALDPVVAMNVAVAVDNSLDVERQKYVLMTCDAKLKRRVAELPEYLSVWAGPPSRSPSSNATLSNPSSFDDHTVDATEERHRRFEVACDVQKANIHVSYLSSRSYLVEKYYNACSPMQMPQSFSHGAGLSQAANEARLWIHEERSGIASELLHVLSSIRPIHFEPSGASLTMKVRQITSTLLPEAPGPCADSGWQRSTMLESDGVFAQYMRTFLEILVDLERGCKIRSGAGEAEDDEDADLRRWADMRQHQRSYMQRDPLAAKVA